MGDGGVAGRGVGIVVGVGVGIGGPVKEVKGVVRVSLGFDDVDN